MLYYVFTIIFIGVSMINATNCMNPEKGSEYQKSFREQKIAKFLFGQEYLNCEQQKKLVESPKNIQEIKNNSESTKKDSDSNKMVQFISHPFLVVSNKKNDHQETDKKNATNKDA